MAIMLTIDIYSMLLFIYAKFIFVFFLDSVGKIDVTWSRYILRITDSAGDHNSCRSVHPWQQA